MSEDERRELGELETQLSTQPRLVKLARRLSSASVDTGLRRTSVVWGVGGAVGLSLVVAGAAAHSAVVGTVGIVILIATLLVAGSGFRDRGPRAAAGEPLGSRSALSSAVTPRPPEPT